MKRSIVIAGLMAFKRGDVASLLVIIWAVVGIAVMHAGTPSVAAAAWVASGAVAILLVAGVIVHRRRSPALAPAG